MPTYASEHGIGAVLLQEGQGQIQPIAYSSFLPKVPYGLAVRIPGFHPGGPGSTPGMGSSACLCFPCRTASAAETFLVSSGAAAT